MPLHSTIRRRAQRRGQSRRGIILLMVTTVLVMFTLVALTFAVTSRQHKVASRALLKGTAYDDRFEELLERAWLQALRGTTNPRSVIGPHSLLEDMYGGFSIGATVGARQYLAQGSLLQIAARGSAQFIYPDGGASSTTLSYRYGFYSGCVLTMVNGPCKMQSTRIVSYYYNTNNGTGVFQVLPFANGAVPSQNNSFLINGRAFSGTGFGLNSNSGTTNRQDPSTGQLYALLPNPAYFSPIRSGVTSPLDQGYVDPAGPGGANEDFDIPDYNNMLLAGRFWDATANPPRWKVLIPSLHRPALANFYWNNSNSNVRSLARANSLNGRRFQRRYILRPLDPGFNGSNTPPNRDPIRAPDTNNDGLVDYDRPGQQYLVEPWDVDNDGDGYPDGVWVDIGMPVQTAPDGRLYKPLVSYLVLDMDGRLNLNAHTNVQHLANKTNLPTVAQTTLDANSAGNAQLQWYAGLSPSGFNNTLSVPIGQQGYGTAEVNLRVAFGLNVAGQFDLAQLLYGGASNRMIDGRYGELWRLNGSAPYPSPGLTNNSPNRDTLDYTKNFQFPLAYSHILPYPGAASYFYNSDIDGNDSVALDRFGHPIRHQSNNEGNNLEHPYQFNPYQERTDVSGGRLAARDKPFNMAEAEELLRPWDIDTTTLPDRISRLAPNNLSRTNISNQAEKLRGILTAESYDPPVYTASMFPFAVNQQGQNQQSFQNWIYNNASRLTLGDLLRLRIYQQSALANPPGTWLSDAQLSTVISSYFPPDIVNGLRWNINHPLGNGRDDDGDGIVDEPDEVAQGLEKLWNVQLDLLNDGNPTPPGGLGDGVMARQQYARYLYVLMMLLKDVGYTFPSTENLPAQYTPQRIAQWAVNCVDFRDADSIMTPFKFDPQPFFDADGDGNYWDVDNTTLNTQRNYIVWGCERPQLLLTETLAWHDIRTQDTNQETDSGNGMGEYVMSATNPTDMDSDFDQARMPDGALYIELFNPQLDRVPAELRRGVNGPSAVDLNKVVGQGANVRPVWQLVITSQAPNLGNKPDTDPLHVQYNNGSVDRIVWFATQGQLGATPIPGNVFYSTDGTYAAQSLVGPGQYAVVGPPGPNAAAPPNGFTRRERIWGSSATPPTNAITIDLYHPNQMVGYRTGSGLNTYNPNLNRVSYPTVGTQIQLPRGLVMNRPNTGLNISIPINGYGVVANASTNDPDDPSIQYTDKFSPPLDSPLDGVQMRQLGTRPNYRTVYLQRLADPTRAYDGPSGTNTNPYISVDSAPIDLTVFNSVQANGGATTDPAVQAPMATRFASRERAGDSPNFSDVNLWKRSFQLADLNNNAGSSSLLTHSLGFLSGFRNKGNGTDTFFAAGAAPNSGVWTSANSINPLYYGSPKNRAFPWLVWNDRPFTNAMELLLVPASSPSRLTWEFGGRNSNNPNQYQDNAGQNNPNYRHLLNFFVSSNFFLPNAGPPPTQGSFGQPGNKANFYRLFEFVHTPSRFDGSETIFNPTSMYGGGTTHVFHPPFNRISNFREPGKVNINTIFDDGTTWGALTNAGGALVNNLQANGAPVSSQNVYSPHWSKIFVSRQGYYSPTAFPSPAPLKPTLNANSPTFFTNPFRSFAAGYNLPAPPLSVPPPSVPPVATPGAPLDIDATLLRRDPTDTSRPLLAAESNSDTNFVGFWPATSQYNDGDRSAYFRYQPMVSLGNKLTTRSNVYAVWITCGFFEAVPDSTLTNQDSADGFRLGRELGSDTGAVIRHRAFGVYDRSIPVAFQRGEDNNVRQGVKLWKIIE